MTYKIKTPILKESVEAAQYVIKKVTKRKIETDAANTILRGAQVLQSAVRIDINARLSENKLKA